MIDLAFPIVFMLVVVIGEALILQWLQSEQVNWHDVVFNLNSGHIMLWLFRCVEIFCYGYVAAHCSLGWVESWPPALMWLFAIFAWDFGFYWLHRLHHTLGVLWAVHVVHHQGEHFNLSLGVRNSWYSSLTSIPFFLILALLGVPLYVFVTVSILHYSVQFFNHNAMTPKLGWLEKVFVTPAHHRVHHVNDRAYADKNFGGTFIFWDKLFGSFCPQLPDAPFRYGAGREAPSQNPFWASNLPFLPYLKLPVRRTRQAAFRCTPVALIAGALLLFALVVGYVYRYGYGYDSANLSQAALFLLLAVGAVALGGIAEGRRWGIYVWLLVVLLCPAVFLLYLGWDALYWKVAMLMLALHGLAMAAGWGQRSLAVGSENE